MFKRRALPKGIRHEVFKRDNFKCVDCGRGPPEVPIHVDHILPWIKGGSDEMSNLKTLCKDCNLEKNDLIHENNITSELIIPNFGKREYKKLKKRSDNKCAICLSIPFAHDLHSSIILWRGINDLKLGELICGCCFEKLEKLIKREKETLEKNMFVYNGYLVSEPLKEPPIIKSIQRSDGVGLKFYCWFCRKWHLHGEGEGHRVAHCTNNKSPYFNIGYILKKIYEPNSESRRGQSAWEKWAMRECLDGQFLKK